MGRRSEFHPYKRSSSSLAIQFSLNNKVYVHVKLYKLYGRMEGLLMRCRGTVGRGWEVILVTDLLCGHVDSRSLMRGGLVSEM